MSFAGINTANNYSFFAIPVAWGLAIAPHFYAIALFNKERAPGTEEWDNLKPFANADRIQEAKLSPAMAQRYAKAEATQNNGFTNLPFFAAAVIAGNMARIETKFLNSAVALYLVSRIVYSYLYINGSNKLMGMGRSVSFLTGVGTCFALFIKAGNRYMTGYAGY